MRNYARVLPSFWNRGSGKKLRGKKDAQILALHFMSAPASNMIGLYYHPMVAIERETGLTEAEIREALPLVEEIARYDIEAELVWMPEGAHIQTGETLSIRDHKLKHVADQLKMIGDHPFVTEFIERYYDVYNLAHVGVLNPKKGRPLLSQEAPQAPQGAIAPQAPQGVGGAPKSTLEPLRGLPPDPAPESAPAPAPARRARPAAPQGAEGSEAPLTERAGLWLKDSNLASLRYPQPETWPEMVALHDRLAAVFGHAAAERPRHHADPRAEVPLKRWAEGIPQEELLLAIEGAKAADDIVSKSDHLQTVMTILKDAAVVAKYVRIARAKAPASPKSRAQASAQRAKDEEALARRKRAQLDQALNEATPQERAAAEERAKAITGAASDLFR